MQSEGTMNPMHLIPFPASIVGAGFDMSENLCPCCGNRYQDLGWHNNERSRLAIDTAVKHCRDKGHNTSDGPTLEVSEVDRVLHPYKRFENIYGCHLCKYIYRTDSSD